MKRILYCIVLLAGIASSQLDAQVTAYTQGLTIRKMLLDYQSQNGGNIASFKEYRHGYEVAYNRTLSGQVLLSLPVRYGVIDHPSEESRFLSQQLLSLDAQVQYHFNERPRRIVPYVVGGLGTNYELGESFNFQIPAGIGCNIRLTDRASISLQSEYRYSLGTARNNLQHGLGFTYMLGEERDPSALYKKDMDEDGIADDMDLCPEIKGVLEFSGCPDTDEDGVPDFSDKCNEIKGLKEFDGCPDSDGDNVPDNTDECPKVAGPKENNGCPAENKGLDSMKKDADDDGVPDDKDKCPDEKGSIEAGGCPDRDRDGVTDANDKCPDEAGLRIYYGCPDTDGDGIDDSRDKCPKTPGIVANDGCPDIKVEDKRTLELAMQAVQFESGKAILREESNIVLKEIARIMAKYPDFNMVISGHTDDVGNDVTNQILSEQRAKACYEFLVNNGVDASRMKYEGFGESRPITSNDSTVGKRINRRVEFKLIVKQ